jgi:hypothetical protein
MKVYYETFFEEGVKPTLNKVIRVGSESISTAIGVENTEELDNIVSETVYSHMQNMLSYMKSLVSQATLVEIGVLPDEGLPVIGWVDVMKLNEEINRWWLYLYYKNENPQVLPH